ncbi:MAG: radical SAM protein [Candidatus Scalindua sp.]
MIQNRRDLIKRERLANFLPLATPFTIYIDPSSACNFKCNFCCHSIKPDHIKRSGFKPQIMDFELFSSVIEQIRYFPDKIKMLSLFLVGEPLLNKRLPDMIAYAKESMIADRIFLTTNGSLLTKQVSRILVDAGLDEILISVEALDTEKYRDITSVNIDYELFVNNIRELYENRKNCKIFIKIVNTAINNEEIEKFHSMYDEICDLAYIETVMPVFDGVDYSSNKFPESNNIGRQVEVCTRPFFTMSVHPNGNVGCCIVDYSEGIVFGNIKEQSLMDIWNGKKFNDFRLTHLKKQRQSLNVCDNCCSPYYDTQALDILDDKADDFLKIFRDE